MSDTTRVSLGPVEAFGEFPAPITVGTRRFYLVRHESGHRLLSSTCPHQGGTVVDEGTRFECPIHNWRFDRTTGRCLNAPSRALASYSVTAEGGLLYAHLPPELPAEHVRGGERRLKPGLTIQLHAHACLEISFEGFTLLTDPWLDGQAFFGAWAHYPAPEVDGSELRPDAILITHEHSDHFHEPTLRHFDRRTPVYVPDFPNQRLPQRLRALGFSDTRVLRFGEKTTAGPSWSLTAFEPNSSWNDAMVLVDVDGFRIFDINDAGINARIAQGVGPVDLLAVQFSAGASGYPWTWAHLTDAQKVGISQQMCEGKLALVREAAAIYHASAVLPFASHFTLWHPRHRTYAALMKRNTVAGVKAAMEGGTSEVIDLLPGDTWDVGHGEIRRAHEATNDLFTLERLEAYRASAFHRDKFATHHPTQENLTDADLTAYLLRLNEVPEIALCEPLTVRIIGVPASTARAVDVTVGIAHGRLDRLDHIPERPNLTMKVPLAILTAVVREDLSWDEAFIGYWCEFDRHPNVYHAGFWRLFQAPYYKKPVHLGAPAPHDAVTRQSTIAELLEQYGADADRVLRRYGLYCNGCHHSTAESIELAARQHGIETRRVELLVKELNRAIFGAPERTL